MEFALSEPQVTSRKPRRAATRSTQLQEDRYEPGKTSDGPKPHRQPLSDLSRQFVESEKAVILSALLRNNGNRTKTAADLGISRTTLWRKIAMYQLNNTG